jgi:hypothetical protein
MSTKTSNVDMYSADACHIHVKPTRFSESARRGDQHMCRPDFFDRCHRSQKNDFQKKSNFSKKFCADLRYFLDDLNMDLYGSDVS